MPSKNSMLTPSWMSFTRRLVGTSRTSLVLARTPMSSRPVSRASKVLKVNRVLKPLALFHLLLKRARHPFLPRVVWKETLTRAWAESLRPKGNRSLEKLRTWQLLDLRARNLG